MIKKTIITILSLLSIISCSEKLNSQNINDKGNKERVYGIEEDYSMYDIEKSMFEYFVDCVYDKLDDTMIEYLAINL